MNEKRINRQFISVPFKADSSNGITEYNGIAKFSPAGIVFEFDSVFLGMIESDVKEVRVSLDEILDIRFRRGIYKFFAQIQIRLKHFAKLNELPNDGSRIKMKIKREDYELAERAVEQTLHYLNEVAHPALQEDVSLRKPLPAQTSVSELFDTEKLKTKDSKATSKLD